MKDAAKKSTFALFFGNRGFFPSSLIASAREEMTRVLKDQGFGSIMLDSDATSHGAVETREDGETYARFLNQHDGQFDGVILCLPNFGDENGAVAGLRDAGVPILIQAYPDSLDKMATKCRRDAFCGKVSVMNVFHQSGIPFTALKPHTISPDSPVFAANLDHFDRVCRVVKGLRGMTIGSVGARTSPFKTVRIDEAALQRHGITVETFDLSQIFSMMKDVNETDAAFKDKTLLLKDYADFSLVPENAVKNIVRLAVVFDDLINQYKLDALGVRCWLEMQQLIGISPCVVMSELNQRGISAACEVDIGNAVAMHALSRASNGVATCLDWNNNYGDDEDKCILFHCGPVPQSMMKQKGRIEEQAIFTTSGAAEPGCSFGCNVGRLKSQAFTFSSMTTESGRLKFYIGEGQVTDDPIPENFFGSAGVVEIPGLQDVLLHIGENGHRHHVSLTPGHVLAPVKEALVHYLGFHVSVPQHQA
jgi:L-fucose isomerase-like protein